jgi:hypothetical protein
MEDCPRGLWSLLGKQVGVKTTQVRILYLPPIRSLSSLVERFLDMEEAVGAIPTGITNSFA